MNFLNGYGSEEEGDETSSSRVTTTSPIPEPVPVAQLIVSSRAISNPIVSTTALSVSLAGKNNASNVPLIGTDMVIASNPTMDIMFAAPEGPKHPYKDTSLGTDSSTTVRKLGMGYIENTTMDDTSFDEQYKSFLKSGYAVSAGNNTIVGDYQQYLKDNNQYQATQLSQLQPPQKKSRVNKAQRVAERQSRQMRNILTSIGGLDGSEGAGEEGEEGEDGPWGAMPVATSSSSSSGSKKLSLAAAAATADGGDEDTETRASSAPEDTTSHIIEPDEEEEKWERVNERKRAGGLVPPRPARGSKAPEASTSYHGPAALDTSRNTMNRSWVLPPLGVKPEDEGETHACYMPKKCIKKFTGHTKGVQCIELIPRTGHLCLSGSLDGKCKMWSLYDDSSDFGGAPGSGRGLRRTYNGHSEGVRSIDFNAAGDQFLSSSFDRYMRLWNVETGAVVGTFGNRKMGYQAKFAPKDNNLFLMAASDNKVYQWDIRTGDIVLEYNYHLAPVNTITYFDDGNKFMTTSDDKKILVWELDTPVPLTQLAEEGMHSIPSLTMHPSGSTVVGQSMDNSIVSFAATHTIKPLKKKRFKGHNNSGYACQIGFSPNGQYMASGDGFGMLHFWDWKTTKNIRKFQAHDNGPCMGAQWHPLQPSWLVTCGWDGVIKLWE